MYYLCIAWIFYEQDQSFTCIPIIPYISDIKIVIRVTYCNAEGKLFPGNRLWPIITPATQIIMLYSPNMEYPSEKHLKLKSRKISFVHNSHIEFPIILKFCTEHGSTTAVLCAKFQNYWTIKTDVMDERDFTRFEFKMLFGQISHIAHGPR